MSSSVSSVTPQNLRALIRDGAELALIDVSEHGQYGMGHIIQASNIPYSTFEPALLRLVPWRGVRLVLTDHEDGAIARKAAGRALAFGYRRVSILDGGNRAWRESGFHIHRGEDVLSKAFGETVEHRLNTPHITPEALQGMMKDRKPFLLLDTRTPAEHRAFRVPGSINVPNGETLYRLSAVLKDEETPVVLHCAGRTRSIIGAQTLINAGLRNPVFALSGGTMGWNLAGFQLEQDNPDTRPAVSPEQLECQRPLRSTLSSRYEVPVIDMETLRAWRADQDRATYLFDIRSAEEFAAGHLAGSVHVPGGQLVQRTGRFCVVTGARIVLCDDRDLIRATTTAHWLIQMGWQVYVISHDGEALADQEAISDVTTFGSAESGCPEVTVDDVRAHIARGATVIDVGASMNHRVGHLPRARWALRPTLPQLATSLPTGEAVIIYGDTAEAAHLAAYDLCRLHSGPVSVYPGGLNEWKATGGNVSASPSSPADAECIDFLFWGHGRQQGNQEAARAYFDWELALHTATEQDDTIAFKIH